MRRSGFRIALTLAVMLGASSAAAQNDANKTQARELGEKAFAALDHQDWAQAETLFLQAEALYHAPTLLLGAARAEAHLGKYIEAWESYHRILLEGAPPGANPILLKAIEDAKVEIEQVAGKRAKVTMTVSGADSPKVTLDGAVLPNAALGVERPVNPGKHTVHAEAAGMKPADGTFTVDEGKATTFALALEKDPNAEAPPPPPVTQPGTTTPGADTGASPGSMNRTLAYVAFGVGGVGLVTGVITGIMALGKHSDLQSNPCSTAPCNSADGSAFNSDLSSYHTVSTISTIGFIVGVVGGAGGAVLLLTAPKKEAQARTFTIAPTVGLGTVGAVGRF